MREQICDDRQTDEEKYERWKKIHDMTDEEFKEYVRNHEKETNVAIA